MPQWMQDLTAGWPMIMANLPTFFVIAALIFGVVWAAMSWSYGAIIKRQTAEIKLLERQKAESDKAPKALADRAHLRLHVYGDTRTPDRLQSTNIWRWYYLHEVFRLIHQDQSKNRDVSAPKLFVTFDPSVSVGTLRVTADKPLPVYEVKEFNNRFAIVVFHDSPPECNLDVEVFP